jgi:putative flippase GtrA
VAKKAGPQALRPGLFSAAWRHEWTRQFGRYLLVGIWNTLFGYATFALLTAALTPILPYGYMWASLICSLLNITVAYLGYKFFVFETKGNYLREWLRCVSVYGTAMVFGLIALPVLVTLIRRNTPFFSKPLTSRARS